MRLRRAPLWGLWCEGHGRTAARPRCPQRAEDSTPKLGYDKIFWWRIIYRYVYIYVYIYILYDIIALYTIATLMKGDKQLVHWIQTTVSWWWNMNGPGNRTMVIEWWSKPTWIMRGITVGLVCIDIHIHNHVCLYIHICIHVYTIYRCII